MKRRQVYWNDIGSGNVNEVKFRFCPVCGEELTIGEDGNEKRSVCKCCGFIHYRNPIPSVSLIIVKDDQILPGKRTADAGKGQWATPSGYIEMEEDFISAAKREAKEETGLDIRVLSILIVNSSFLPSGYHILNTYLLTDIVHGELKPSDDLKQTGWFQLHGPFPEMAFQEDLDMIAYFREAGDTGIPVQG